jgi:hypothetical protein
MVDMLRFHSGPKDNYTIWAHIHAAFSNIFFAAMSNTFIIGYFRTIGFSEMHIGVYGMLAGIGGMSCIFGPWISQRTGLYKKTSLMLLTIARAACMLGVLVGAFEIGSMKAWVPILTLFFMLIYQLGLYMSTPVILSWFHDLTGRDGWQRFFSVRMIISDTTVLLTSLVIGNILGDSPTRLVFVVVFMVAILFGFGSNFFMGKMPDARVETMHTGVWEYLKKIWNASRQPAFRTLFIILFLRAFAYGLIMPFQPVFLLEVLHFDYGQMSILVTIATSTAVVGYRFWTVLQRRYNNAINFKWNLYLSIFDPLIWAIAAQGNKTLIYIAVALFGLAGVQGLINSGYFLSCIGSIFDRSTDDMKPIFTSMYYVLFGIASSIAPLLGGYFIQSFNRMQTELFIGNLAINGYSILFAIASVLLVIAACLSAFSTPRKELKRSRRAV